MTTQEDDTRRRITFIGLGVMGSAMAGHLIKAGHHVTGYDQNPKTGGPINTASSAAEAVANAEIIITMLPDGDIVSQVVRDIAGAIPPGALFIDTSSAEAWLTQANAELLASTGVHMIDAPVSGAEWGAKAAELVFMVGGDPADVDRARPILDIMGQAVHHVGPLGAGHVMKSVNNVVTAATVIATAEAMEIGRTWGLDPHAMVDVLDSSTGGSWWSATRLRQDVLNGAFVDGFKMALMQKDVRIANDLASMKDLTPHLLAQTLDIWSEAKVKLGPGRPITEMAPFAAKRLHSSD